MEVAWAPKTIRTARSLSSEEYLFPLLMTPTSQTLGPPANRGRFTGLQLGLVD